MEQQFYSVEEIAKILDLHPKTVRRFIREGKLKARKIGRTWKISQENFKEYAHGELKQEEAPEKGQDAGIDYQGIEQRITVSAVIEITEQESEEASRISNSLIALLNSKDPAWGRTRFDFIYHPEIRKARFILYGSPRFISAVMKSFEVITRQ
jgi:excisionase family DNA binding protein